MKRSHADPLVEESWQGQRAVQTVANIERDLTLAVGVRSLGS